jgi:hypothetical protein
VLVPLLLAAFVPILLPLRMLSVARARRFEARRVAAKGWSIGMSDDEKLDVFKDGARVAEIPIADITRARWWVHGSHSLASGMEEETLVEVDVVDGRRIVASLAYNAGFEPLIACGLLSREPLDGGQRRGLLDAFLILAVVVWGLAVALLWRRYGP